MGSEDVHMSRGMQEEDEHHSSPGGRQLQQSVRTVFGQSQDRALSAQNRTEHTRIVAETHGALDRFDHRHFEPRDRAIDWMLECPGRRMCQSKLVQRTRESFLPCPRGISHVTSHDPGRNRTIPK